MQNDKRLETLRRKLTAKVSRNVVNMVKEVLALKHECGHDDHRLQPNRYDDWKAIDNLMLNILSVLLEQLPEMLTSMAVFQAEAFKYMSSEHSDEIAKKAELEIQTELGQQVIQHECTVKACVEILFTHQLLIVEYGRGNNADIHYARIVNKISEAHTALINRLDTHDTQEGINEQTSKEVEDLLSKLKKGPKDKLH